MAIEKKSSHKIQFILITRAILMKLAKVTLTDMNK